MRQVYLKSKARSSIVETVGAITLAMERVGKNKTCVGVAFCSPTDQFVKSKGRELAHTRCLNTQSNLHFVVRGSIAKHNDTVIKALSHIIANQLYPNWAKPLVEQELALHCEAELLKQGGYL